MGLAPYGRPVYYELIKNQLIDIKPDGSYRLNLDYFDYQYGRAMTNDKFEKLFGGKRRMPESAITQREMDMAASVQKVIEEVIILLARYLRSIISEDVKNLVFAGGVALNCVANGILKRENIFNNLWIQPAAGDAGGAIGASLFYYYQYRNNKRNVNEIHDTQKNSYLGPCYSNDSIEEFLKKHQYTYHKIENRQLFYDQIAKLLEKEKVIGLFEGRMEFGPRALGNRSIIADPRSSDMQAKLNLKIKYRESFRPFAPSVLEEKVSEYFEIESDSPYMLICADVQKGRRKEFRLGEEIQKSDANLLSVVNKVRSDIPAVTHVDYSARIQTVNEKSNQIYYGIIKAFERLTGCAVLINTSFNVRGEPIVCTPEDAYLCFMRTEMDVLVLGNCILYKEEQPVLKSDEDWRSQYELD